MKIDLNKNLVDLDGSAIADSNMGKILGNALATAGTGDALKFWDWAQKLYAGKALDLDPSDLATLKAFVSAEAKFPVLTKAQILALL